MLKIHTMQVSNVSIMKQAKDTFPKLLNSSLDSQCPIDLDVHLTLYQSVSFFDDSEEKRNLKTWWENAGISLFSTMISNFLLIKKQIPSATFKLSSATASNLDNYRFCYLDAQSYATVKLRASCNGRKIDCCKSITTRGA